MAAGASNKLSVLSRFAAAFVGSYAFAFGFAAICTLAGFAAGLAFDESRTLAWMLGFLVFLTSLLWAFTPRSSKIVWVVLGGGGLIMSAAAWMLARMISG